MNYYERILKDLKKKISDRDLRIRDRLRDYYENNKDEDWFDRISFIRQAYMEMLPLIYDATKNSKKGWADPYYLYWIDKFTPIEQTAWNAIRYEGAVLYPQFPILNKFVDFANPYIKIGLEVDGKQHDKEKDKERDLSFKKLGWRIFRVPSNECRKTTKYLCDIEHDKVATRAWFHETVEGVVCAIYHIYFEWRFEKHEYHEYMISTLNEHKIIDFPVSDEIFIPE
jgi:very-short-patch-repair endonuclease